MIKFVRGSIFDSPTQALINTVNCEGVMGKGLALQFKKRYNEMYKDYVKVCFTGELRPGKLHTFTEKGKLIINFPTKDTWRKKSKMQYVEDGLDALNKLVKAQNIKSVAVPPLGAGNGGLNWDDVKKVIVSKLEGMSSQVDFFVYEPIKNINVPSITIPQLGVRAYLLMDIITSIGTNTYTKIKGVTYFVNYLLGKKYFYIERVGKLPKEGVVEDILKDIERYKAYYGKQSYAELKNILKKQIGGKKLENDNVKVMPYVIEGCNIVKDFSSEDKLECGITIVEMLRQSRKKVFNKSDLLIQLSEKYNYVICEDVFKVLCNHGIIEQSLFGIQLNRNIF